MSFFVHVCLVQVDDRQVASDGFMLNFMTVLQQLCGKVKIEKVSHENLAWCLLERTFSAFCPRLGREKVAWKLLHFL